MINLRDLLGIPFTNRGRTLDGLDCYGLVMEVYKKFGITLPEYNADFDDTENITKIIRKQMREEGIVYKVYKNTMLNFAIKGTEYISISC